MAIVFMVFCEASFSDWHCVELFLTQTAVKHDQHLSNFEDQTIGLPVRQQ